jgi:hypothetical protein
MLSTHIAAQLPSAGTWGSNEHQKRAEHSDRILATLKVADTPPTNGAASIDLADGRKNPDVRRFVEEYEKRITKAESVETKQRYDDAKLSKLGDRSTITSRHSSSGSRRPSCVESHTSWRRGPWRTVLTIYTTYSIFLPI